MRRNAGKNASEKIRGKKNFIAQIFTLDLEHTKEGLEMRNADNVNELFANNKKIVGKFCPVIIFLPYSIHKMKN